jgi:hypothetical protein
MFNQIFSSLGSIFEHSDGQYDCAQKYCLVNNMNPSNYGFMLNYITEQPYITNPNLEFSIYKLPFVDGQFEYITNSNDSHTWPITFSIADNCIMMNIISVESLLEFLNIDKDLIFLPVFYECTLKNNSHLAMVIINKQNKSVHFLEPNGNPSFFDSLMSYNIGDKLEEMLTGYFNEMSVYDCHYKYIPTKQWNNKNIYLNKQFNQKTIGSGHCAILSLFLGHLSLYYTPEDMFKRMETLSDEEIEFLITEYSAGIYNILKNNKRLLHEDYYIKKYNDTKLLCPDIDISQMTDFYESIKKSSIKC